MKKLIFILIASSLTIGCTSFQPSTYSNRSTQYGNVVSATGNAASAAASANSSYNCPSCVSNQTRYGSSVSASTGAYIPPRNHIDTIADSITSTLTNSISSSINAKIYDAFK